MDDQYQRPRHYSQRLPSAFVGIRILSGCDQWVFEDYFCNPEIEAVSSSIRLILIGVPRPHYRFVHTSLHYCNYILVVTQGEGKLLDD